MKLNMEEELKGFDGKSVKDGPGENAKNMTVRTACVEAILMPNDSMDGAAKVKAYQFAAKCANGKSLELSLDEVAYLKTAIDAKWATLVYGIMNDMFEKATK